MFERYNITDDEDLREAAIKTEAYVLALSVKSTLLLHGARRMKHGQNTDNLLKAEGLVDTEPFEKVVSRLGLEPRALALKAPNF